MPKKYSIQPVTLTWQHNIYVTIGLDISSDGSLRVYKASGSGTANNMKVCYPQSDTFVQANVITKIDIPQSEGQHNMAITVWWDNQSGQNNDNNNHTITFTVISSGSSDNNKVVLSDGTVLIDLTADTVDAEHLLQGYTAHDKSGALITGTASGGEAIIELPSTSDWESTTFTLDNNYFISSEYTIPSGYTLIIPESYFLIVKYNSSYPTLTNNGTIRIPSGTNSNRAVIYLFSDCGLVNNGLIELNDGTIYVEQDSFLTNSVGATINGTSGFVFNYLGEIINNGTWGSSVRIENKWGNVTGATIYRDWVLSEPLTATENKTYTAPSGQAYSPVTVNVSGGTSGEVDSGVIFIDYDGSIVTAWASGEVAGKTTLPDNPTHDGLVAQGWNWSLANIKSYVTKYPNANVLVGQMYETVSGLTEMDITVTKVTGLTVTCKMSGRKDWGDGTTDSATSHTYADYGNYTITCDGTNIPAGTSTSGGMFDSRTSSVNRFWCTAIRIGENVTSIGDYAFNNCYSLTNITIPESVTSIGTYAFRNCYSLTNVTIPNNVTSIDASTFYNCYSLTNIMIPESVTSIGDSAFYNCYSLTNITIPESVTSIGTYAFRSCYSLTNITIPENITRIGASAFYDCYSLTNIMIPESVTSIGASTFYDCYSLTNITIPENVTSIGTSAFNNCHSLIYYDFSTLDAIPTLSNTNAFNNINNICKIIVPDALYDDWITATNWSTYANYIYKASEVAA